MTTIYRKDFGFFHINALGFVLEKSGAKDEWFRGIQFRILCIYHSDLPLDMFSRFMAVESTPRGLKGVRSSIAVCIFRKQSLLISTAFRQRRFSQ